jgi:hypothetical protein
MTDTPENEQKDTEYRARAAITYILYSSGQLSAPGKPKSLLFKKNSNVPNLYSISIKNGERRDYDVIAATLQRLGLPDTQVDILPLRVTIKSNTDPFEKLALYFTAPNGAMVFESSDITLLCRIAKDVAGYNPVMPIIDKNRQNHWPASGARHSISQALKKQKVQQGDLNISTSEDGKYTHISLASTAVPYRDALKMGLSESGFLLAKDADEGHADRITLEGNVVNQIANICCIDGKVNPQSELLRRLTENVQHHLLSHDEKAMRWTELCSYVKFPANSPSR